MQTFNREIRNQNIWGNKYIKFNNKSLIYKNWIDSNLLYVNDIKLTKMGGYHKTL